MKVRKVIEVSCYMENKPGVLGNVAGALAKEGINIVGIHSYEGQLQNMTRFVVDDAHVLKTEMVLRGLGIEFVSQTEILEVYFTSQIGFISTLCSRLGKEGLNINVMYFTESPDGSTMAYIAIDEIDRAIEVLETAAQTDEFADF